MFEAEKDVIYLDQGAISLVERRPKNDDALYGFAL
jgi:hypothetical protein